MENITIVIDLNELERFEEIVQEVKLLGFQITSTFCLIPDSGVIRVVADRNRISELGEIPGVFEAFPDIDGPALDSCCLCQSKDIFTTIKDDPIRFGLGVEAITIPCKVPVRTCRSCKISWTDYEAEDLREAATAPYREALKRSKT